MKTLIFAIVGSILCAAVSAQTFVDRLNQHDIRILDYNVFFDFNFGQGLDKFERIVNAVQPDILTLQEASYDLTASDVAAIMQDIDPQPNGWYAEEAFWHVTVSKYPLTLHATNINAPRPIIGTLVDVPGARDLYLINSHWFHEVQADQNRQQQADAMTAHIRDMHQTLPQGTPIISAGDFNIRAGQPEINGQQPLITHITGDIIDEATFGLDSPPDWDGSDLADAQPAHNAQGSEELTWRNEVTGPGLAGRIDYALYTNSVLHLKHSYVLNTMSMTAADLMATGLLAGDSALRLPDEWDHLPLVVDFAIGGGDFNNDGVWDCNDIDPLVADIVGPGTPETFDLTGDGNVDLDDRDAWLADGAAANGFGSPFLLGDADLNGTVDFVDFNKWAGNRFTPTAAFCAGDWNASGIVDLIDFNLWSENRFQSSDSLPEPSTLLLFGLGGLLILRLRRRVA